MAPKTLWRKGHIHGAVLNPLFLGDSKHLNNFIPYQTAYKKTIPGSQPTESPSANNWTVFI